MEKTQIATKLTIAGMGLTKEVIQGLLADKKEGDTVIIARIFGKTSKYDAKPSKLDPTRMDYAFRGVFEGHNLIDGTVHNAPKAYLPGAAEGATAAAIDGLAEGESVAFGCEIAVKKQASSAVGYVFGVAVPKQPQTQDPLAELREQLGGAPTAALPAPSTEKQPKPAKKEA